MYSKKYNKKLTVFQAVFIRFLDVYQMTISPDHGVLKKIGIKKTQTCVFYPTCSKYAKQAIERYGVVKGVRMGAKRVWRCRPKEVNHIDPLV